MAEIIEMIMIMIMGLASISPQAVGSQDIVHGKEGKTLKMISLAYLTVFGKQRVAGGNLSPVAATVVIIPVEPCLPRTIILIRL